MNMNMFSSNCFHVHAIGSWFLDFCWFQKVLGLCWGYMYTCSMGYYVYCSMSSFTSKNIIFHDLCFYKTRSFMELKFYFFFNTRMLTKSGYRTRPVSLMMVWSGRDLPLRWSRMSVVTWSARRGRRLSLGSQKRWVIILGTLPPSDEILKVDRPSTNNGFSPGQCSVFFSHHNYNAGHLISYKWVFSSRALNTNQINQEWRSAYIKYI